MNVNVSEFGAKIIDISPGKENLNRVALETMGYLIKEARVRG
jgi:hypothetical protein